MAHVKVASRRKMASSSFGLPREKKYIINTKKRAVSAVAYAKKNVKHHKITAAERDRILRKVHARWPDIQIAPTSGFRMKAK